MACIYCEVDLHAECVIFDVIVFSLDDTYDFQRQEIECCCHKKVPVEKVQERIPGKVGPPGGPIKEDDEVKDPKSTGRKRAAVEYPIPKEGMVCEWSELRFAGGGKYPIIGCIGQKATHRHHGPDKNTLNNNKGNVHRICVHCHNRWHGRNDPVYDQLFGTPEWKAHDPDTKATPIELLGNEAHYAR